MEAQRPSFVVGSPSIIRNTEAAVFNAQLRRSQPKIGRSFAGLRTRNAVDGVQPVPKSQDRTRQVTFEVSCSSVAPRKVLVIGGTRFSGVYLVKALQDAGHEVTLFNRGKTPMPKLHNETESAFERRMKEIRTIVGDRKSADSIRSALQYEKFDVIYDNNGREAKDTKPLADLFADKIEHYIYMSSAGTYKMDDSSLPYRESDPVDPKSRHKGKFESEEYLRSIKIPFTSVRPTYIYGPENYNEVEAWFFHRIYAGRPVPIPGHGQHVTGMGHVVDLADAMVKIIGNPKVQGQIYNIQGDRYVTFDGLARACAEAMGKGDIDIVHYNPKDFNFGKRKAFPFRLQHFFTDISKAVNELDWTPKYSLVEGLADSYWNDYVSKALAGKVSPDFSTDDEILAKAGKVPAAV